MGRNDGISQDKPDKFPAHIAIGIHARDNFLSRVASFVEAERFAFKIGLRRNDLLVQIWPSFRETSFHAQGLSSLGSDRPDSKLGTSLQRTRPSREEAFGWKENLNINFARFFGAQHQRRLPPDLCRDKIDRLQVCDVHTECGLNDLSGFGSADQQESPGLGTVLHLGLGSVEQEFAEGLECGFTNLTDVFHCNGVVLHVEAEVREHLAFVGQQTGLAPLSWLQGEDVVADDALQPLHAILTRDPELAAMGEVSYSHGFADGTMFNRDIPIMRWHLPTGDLLKRRAKLGMLLVKA